MDQQRRFLIAMILLFALLFAYEQLVVRPYRKTAPPSAPHDAQTAPEGAPAPEPERGPAPGQPAGGHGLAATADDSPTVTVETDRFRATLTTLGARLKARSEERRVGKERKSRGSAQ